MKVYTCIHTHIQFLLGISFSISFNVLPTISLLPSLYLRRACYARTCVCSCRYVSVGECYFCLKAKTVEFAVSSTTSTTAVSPTQATYIDAISVSRQPNSCVPLICRQTPKQACVLKYTSAYVCVCACVRRAAAVASLEALCAYKLATFIFTFYFTIFQYFFFVRRLRFWCLKQPSRQSTMRSASQHLLASLEHAKANIFPYNLHF